MAAPCQHGQRTTPTTREGRLQSDPMGWEGRGPRYQPCPVQTRTTPVRERFTKEDFPPGHRMARSPSPIKYFIYPSPGYTEGTNYSPCSTSAKTFDPWNSTFTIDSPAADPRNATYAMDSPSTDPRNETYEINSTRVLQSHSACSPTADLWNTTYDITSPGYVFQPDATSSPAADHRNVTFAMNSHSADPRNATFTMNSPIANPRNATYELESSRILQPYSVCSPSADFRDRTIRMNSPTADPRNATYTMEYPQESWTPSAEFSEAPNQAPPDSWDSKAGHMKRPDQSHHNSRQSRMMPEEVPQSRQCTGSRGQYGLDQSTPKSKGAPPKSWNTCEDKEPKKVKSEMSSTICRIAQELDKVRAELRQQRDSILKTLSSSKTQTQSRSQESRDHYGMPPRSRSEGHRRRGGATPCSSRTDVHQSTHRCQSQEKAMSAPSRETRRAGRSRSHSPNRNPSDDNWFTPPQTPVAGRDERRTQCLIQNLEQNQERLQQGIRRLRCAIQRELGRRTT